MFSFRHRSNLVMSPENGSFAPWARFLLHRPGRCASQSIHLVLDSCPGGSCCPFALSECCCPDRFAQQSAPRSSRLIAVVEFFPASSLTYKRREKRSRPLVSVQKTQLDIFDILFLHCLFFLPNKLLENFSFGRLFKTH